MTIQSERTNHPCIVWVSCFLWLMSLFAITWSFLLFFCVGDVLSMTSTDSINAVLLLSGLIILPTNVNMLYSIAKEKRINHNTKVLCGPIWLSLLMAIVANIVGACLCVHRIRCSEKTTRMSLKNSMTFYRSIPKDKHFIDNIQWAMKCCGMNSYKDWFSHDWYDKTRDYEWDPNDLKRNAIPKSLKITDSVPLSCCKTGSCISNYLNELGTYSIHTKGCTQVMNKIILISMIGHFLVFSLVAFFELLILRFIYDQKQPDLPNDGKTVKEIMEARVGFDYSSDSNPESVDVDSGEK